MNNPAEHGKNKDASLNDKYCCFCFKEGAFTSPNLSLQQMTDRLVLMASKMGLTEKQARERASEKLPKLERWRKNKGA